MEGPHTAQDDSTDRNGMHHDKTNGHQQRDGYHNTDFGLLGHAPACHIVFQIVFVQLGIDEPVMELLRASCKTEGRQQQKWEGGEHRDDSANSANAKANAAEDDIQDFLKIHVSVYSRFFSFFVSITCRMAMTG